MSFFQVPSTPFWGSVTCIFSAGERKGTASHQRLCRGFPASSPVPDLGAGYIPMPVCSFHGCLAAAALTTEPSLQHLPRTGQVGHNPGHIPSPPAPWSMSVGSVSSRGVVWQVETSCLAADKPVTGVVCSQCSGTGGRMLPGRGKEGLERIRDTRVAFTAGAVVVLFFCAEL